jgi:endonuclease III
MKQVDSIFKILDKVVPNLQVPLIDLVEAKTHDPFKVLVATLLSARTKDELTIKLLPKLFESAGTISKLKKISIKKLEKLLYPIGFYKTKAKHLKLLPLVLEEKFGGVIPDDIDSLIELPGVGRKTANLVVVVAFKKPAICVDVHVHRITNRLGLLKTKTPFETEMKLRKTLPKKYWFEFNGIFVLFGKKICTPISPWCSKCPIREYCLRKGVDKSR